MIKMALIDGLIGAVIVVLVLVVFETATALRHRSQK